jgi:hypothetical protein
VNDAPVADDVSNDVQSPQEIEEQPDPTRPRLVVDHVLTETVGSVNGLGGTPALLSDLNTTLGVQHPILTAVNGLQALGASKALPVLGPEFFSGIGIDPPILQAIRDIGFDPIDFGGGLFAQNSDGAFPVLPWSSTRFMTGHGFWASLDSDDQGEAVSVRIALADALGRALRIDSVGQTGVGGTTMVLEPGSDGQAEVYLAKPLAPTMFDLRLENGASVQLKLGPGETEAVTGLTLVAEEIEKQTFTAQTERVSQAEAYEIGLLFEAVKSVGG